MDESGDSMPLEQLEIKDILPETLETLPEPLELLDTTGLYRWLLCLCVVNFDLELGQGNDY